MSTDQPGGGGGGPGGGGPHSGEPSSNSTIGTCNWVWNAGVWTCHDEGTNCNAANRNPPPVSGTIPGQTSSTTCGPGGGGGEGDGE